MCKTDRSESPPQIWPCRSRGPLTATLIGPPLAMRAFFRATLATQLLDHAGKGASLFGSGV